MRMNWGGNWLFGLALVAGHSAVQAGDVMDPASFTQRIEKRAFEAANRHHEQQYRMSQAELNTFLRGDSLTDDEWKFSRSLAREFVRPQRYPTTRQQSTDDSALAISWRKQRNLASRVKLGYRNGTRNVTRHIVGDRISRNLKVDVVGRPKIEYKIRF